MKIAIHGPGGRALRATMSAGLILAGALSRVALAAPPGGEASNTWLVDLTFWALAGLTVVSAAGVAFSRNIIYSALSLLGALLGTGALYIFLNADYLAITQLLIYVGGVLVLILFAVMLTSRIADRHRSNPSSGMLPGLGLLVALLAVLIYVAVRAPWKVVPGAAGPPETARTLGDLFLREYLLPFEVSSLVLLATLIGAVVVARKEIKE